VFGFAKVEPEVRVSAAALLAHGIPRLLHEHSIGTRPQERAKTPFTGVKRVEEFPLQ